jgi:sec-independent protein translocase protein TatB
MLSLPHLVILFIIALLVFGPEKLPELARMLGKAMSEFRRVTTDVRRVVEDEMRDMELKTREADLRRREAELASEREKSIMPPGGGVSQAAALISGDGPTESPSSAPVEGTVPSDRPNNVAAEKVEPNAPAVDPPKENSSDVDANPS